MHRNDRTPTAHQRPLTQSGGTRRDRGRLRLPGNSLTPSPACLRVHALVWILLTLAVAFWIAPAHAANGVCQRRLTTSHPAPRSPWSNRRHAHGEHLEGRLARQLVSSEMDHGRHLPANCWRGRSGFTRGKGRRPEPTPFWRRCWPGLRTSAGILGALSFSDSGCHKLGKRIATHGNGRLTLTHLWKGRRPKPTLLLLTDV